jgi:hypothetical protein
VALEHPPRWRDVLCASAVLILVLALLPPFYALAHRYEWAEGLQFSILGVVVPAVLVVGAPWRRIGLAGWAAALADKRRRHPEFMRTVGFASLHICALVGWRTPGAVDWVARGSWQGVVEAVVLVPAGVGLWLECVDSPPLEPRSTRPVRMAVAAAGMWTIWVLAYLVGLSHADWYPAYRHIAGRGLSLAADQQFTTGTLWFVALCAFVPVIFSNLIAWLRSEEDPDQELHVLARQERRRQAWRPTSLSRAKDRGVPGG